MRSLPSLVALLALVLPLHAQGRVHTVDNMKPRTGALWQLELDADGTVASTLGIGPASPALAHALSEGDAFGASIAPLGDLDGNGIADLAVGAPGDDTGGSGRGAIWILFRAADGGVTSARAVRSGDVALADLDVFGSALAFLGDLDGDGLPELAVGAPTTFGPGAVWILSLRSDGSVAASRRVTEGQAGFGGDLDNGDWFGRSLAPLGDLDGDGIADLAVGAPGDDDGGPLSGALWLLHLSANGTVKSELKLSRTSGGFGGGAGDHERMGESVAPLGDLDGDGVLDLALGAPGYSALFERGSVWILFMNADESVRAQQRIHRVSQSDFGQSMAPLGDLDGDGLADLAVGALNDGAVFLLFLKADGRVRAQLRIDASVPGHAGERLGSLGALGDFDGDGRLDLGLGAPEHFEENDADFVSLQSAVDAAASGDTLLVRPGNYGPVVVTAKSLTIQAEVPLQAIVTHLTVSQLDPSQTVAVSGLTVGPEPTTLDGAIELVDDQGLVWLEECSTLASSSTRAAGLSVQACADVVLNRCVLRACSYGPQDPWGTAPAPAGLELGASTLHAYDCTFVGADGQGLFSDYYDPDTATERGGDGIECSSSSFLFLSGCSAQGGRGRFYHPLGSQSSSCSGGGNGLRCASAAVALDSTFAGGAGGKNGLVPCGTDGSATSGPLELLPGASLSFSTSHLAHEDERIVLTAQGPPGVPVYLLGSPRAAASYRPGQRGSLLLGSPRASRFLGTTDANGTLAVEDPLGLLPPTLEVRRLFVQALMIQPGGPDRVRGVASRVTLGAGKLYLVLDQAFQ